MENKKKNSNININVIALIVFFCLLIIILFMPNIINKSNKQKKERDSDKFLYTDILYVKTLNMDYYYTFNKDGSLDHGDYGGHEDDEYDGSDVEANEYTYNDTTKTITTYFGNKKIDQFKILDIDENHITFINKKDDQIYHYISRKYLDQIGEDNRFEEIVLDEVIGSYKLVSNLEYLHYDEIYIPDIKKSAYYDKKANTYGVLDFETNEIKLRKYAGDDRYYDFYAGIIVYDTEKKTFVGYVRVDNSELTIKDIYKNNGISLLSLGIDINGYYHDGYHKALKEPTDLLESINGPWVEMVVYDDNKYVLKYYNGKIYKVLLDIKSINFKDNIYIKLVIIYQKLKRKN